MERRQLRRQGLGQGVTGYIALQLHPQRGSDGGYVGGEIGGGLGDIAIRYGYYRYETPIMIVTIVILVILVQILQGIGMMLSRKLDRRRT